MADAPSALVGRDDELQAITRQLNAAAAGRGGVLMLSGEAGIGKTALALHTASAGHARGFEVSVGRALELSSAPPWLPIRTCLRSIGIARALLPTAERDVYGLWEDVLAALSERASRAPLLWVLEDMHAADSQTLDLLSFLAHPLRALPALLVITARAVDPLRAGGASERLDRLARAAEVLALGPLPPAATSELIRTAAPRSLSDGRVRELATRAAGHPLFALELARAPSSSRAAIPASVVQVVQERLAALPTETRELLERASVFGRELRASAVGRLVNRMPAVVIDELAPALRARLIEELSPGCFQFTHALLRDAIHDALPAQLRRSLHARAELVLAEQGDTLDRLVLRATHVLEAGDAVDAALGDATITRAVDALRADGAYDRAFALARQRLETLAAVPTPAALIAVAQLAHNAGLHAEHVRLSNDALAAATRADDVRLIAEAALTLGALLRPGIVNTQLVRALQGALIKLEAEPLVQRTLQCRVRTRLAAAMMPAPDYSIPANMARAAIAQARTLGDPKLLREVLHVAASAMTDGVDPSETHALAAELCELAAAAGDEPMLLRALVRRTVHRLALGQLEALDADVDELLTRAAGLGHPTLVWRAWLMASMRALARGDFMASEQALADVHELTRLSDDPSLTLAYEAHSAVREVLLDDAEGLARARAAYLRLLPSTGLDGVIRSMLLLHVALRLDDRVQAAQDLRTAITIPLGPCDPFSFAVVCEGVAYVGDRVWTEKLLPEVRAVRERFAFSSQVDFALGGPMERVIGLMETSLGDHASALASLRAARECSLRHRLTPWVARIDFELGSVLLALARHDEARASFEAALRVASALPLPLVAARCQQQLALLASAGTQDKPSAPPPSAADSKTPTQPVGNASRPEPILTLEGDVWRATYAETAVLLKDSRGLRLLARLIAAPGERVHVLALVNDTGASLAESSAGSAIDATALARYRERLAELDDELASADSGDDLARAERLSEEREALLAELRRAVGLGGRLRKVGSMTERARVNVTRRVRDALSKIAEVHPQLARYLENAVRTGTYCSFRP